MNAIDKSITLAPRSALPAPISAVAWCSLGCRRRAVLPSGSAKPGLAKAAASAPSLGTRRRAATGEVNAWILIEPDDTVTLRLRKSEMGQGGFTALPMIVAEELGCDWSKVKGEHASAQPQSAGKHVYKSMSTGGSSSVRRFREVLQQAGASARVAPHRGGGEAIGVPAFECAAADGKVMHKASGSERWITARSRRMLRKITLAQEPAIKTPDQFTLIGKPMARLDTPLEGQWHGEVRHRRHACPTWSLPRSPSVRSSAAT